MEGFLLVRMDWCCGGIRWEGKRARATARAAPTIHGVDLAVASWYSPGRGETIHKGAWDGVASYCRGDPCGRPGEGWGGIFQEEGEQ